MKNRVEYLAGYLWAKDIAIQSASLLNLAGGSTKMLELLERGTVQKPPSYAQGVREIITTVENALHVRAIGGRP